MSLISPNFDVKSIISSHFGQGPFPKIAGIENVILQCVKNMDFNLLCFSDSAIQVSYKFGMLFFKMALVIKQYVHVALLIAHTVAVLII